MNKKILSVIIAGIIAATALPAMSTSATEVNQKATVNRVSYRPYQRIGIAKAKKAISVYNLPQTNATEIDSFEKGEQFVVYYSGTDKYYAVKLSNGKYGYIRKTTVNLIHP